MTNEAIVGALVVIIAAATAGMIAIRIIRWLQRQGQGQA